MIKHDKIKQLVDGNVPNQNVTFTVITKITPGMEIPPTCVFNVYLNIGAKFIFMEQVMRAKQSAISLPQNKAPDVEYFNRFYFSTTKSNFESNFGKYTPNKILPFEMVKSKIS